MKRALRFLSFGLALPCAVVLALWLGQWLDHRLHSQAFSLTLPLLAFAGTLWQLYREIQRFNAE